MKIHEIPVAKIQPDPQQPRQDIAEPELSELTGSVQKRGLLQPIIVCAVEDYFVTVDGHRRLAAILKLKHSSIPAIVLSERPSADQLLLTQLTTSMMRVDLTPMEQADALHRLQETQGWSNTQISEQLQFSKSKVTRLLSLLKLPQQAQELVKQGTLRPSTAYEISRAKTPEERDRLLAEAASENGLRRDQAKQSVSTKRPKDRRSERLHRANFRLSHSDVVIGGPDSPNLEAVIKSCQELIRECKRASRSGWNVDTLSRILKDQNTANVAAGGSDE